MLILADGQYCGVVVADGGRECHRDVALGSACTVDLDASLGRCVLGGDSDRRAANQPLFFMRGALRT